MRIRSSDRKVPGLLVSVRDLAEARSALAAGADIIDIKEPSLGSLGAASGDTVQAIVRHVRGRVPVTAALGELVDFSARALPPELFAAKVGLARCDDVQARTWRLELASCFATFSAKRVAVAYADYLTCKAPTPEEVVSAATNLGCDFFLIDTHQKTCPLTVLRQQAEIAEQLDASVALANRSGMSVVIAGSLTVADFRSIILHWQPDFVAVRGAACVGNREGQVSGSKVASLKQSLTEASRAARDL